MLKQFLKDEQGQTTVEYLLIIAVIVVVISVMGKGMRTQMENLVSRVFQGVGKKVDQLMNASMGQ